MSLPGKGSLLDATKCLSLPSKVRRAACGLPRIQHALTFLGVASSFGCCTTRLAQSTREKRSLSYYYRRRGRLFQPCTSLEGRSCTTTESSVQATARQLVRPTRASAVVRPAPRPLALAPRENETIIFKKIPSKILFSETGSTNSPFRFRALTVLVATLFCFSMKATGPLDHHKLSDSPCSSASIDYCKVCSFASKQIK